MVTYVYEGKAYNVDLLVNIEQKTTPINPDGPNTDGKVEKDDNKAVVIAVSVVVPVVVIAGVAAAVLVILKRRKQASCKAKKSPMKTTSNRTKRNVGRNLAGYGRQRTIGRKIRRRITKTLPRPRKRARTGENKYGL